MYQLKLNWAQLRSRHGHGQVEKQLAQLGLQALVCEALGHRPVYIAALYNMNCSIQQSNQPNTNQQSNNKQSKQKTKKQTDGWMDGKIDRQTESAFPCPSTASQQFTQGASTQTPLQLIP
jgi:hypothetical protein